ncbi:MAG TPA: hypothetical protein VFD15_04150, partial [Clostridia bacterium]|nr:hypothetical protein [Clostridia bacterium]
FNGIKETDTASQASPGLGNVAVKRNNYCFKPGSKPQAPAVPPIDVLPKQIADFFTRAFLDGSRDPKARPTALEWYNALGQYENLLVKCNKNSAHEYYNALNSCPWCEADDRFRKACAPSMTQRKFAQPPVVVQPPPSQQRTYGTASATARQTQLPGGTTGTTPHPANLPYGGGVGGMGGVGGTGAGGGMSGVGGTGGPGTGAPGGTGGTGGGSTKRTPDAPDIGWKIVPLILGSALLYNILYKSLINQDPETTVVFAITSVIAIVLMSLVKFEYVERLALGSITFPVVAIAYDVIFSELSSSFWDWFATIVLGPFVFALLLALPCYFIMWIQDLNKSP